MLFQRSKPVKHVENKEAVLDIFNDISLNFKSQNIVDT